jgi:hypothetical protein
MSSVVAVLKFAALGFCIVDVTDRSGVTRHAYLRGVASTTYVAMTIKETVATPPFPKIPARTDSRFARVTFLLFLHSCLCNGLCAIGFS